jgi:hypothetical protein
MECQDEIEQVPDGKREHTEMTLPSCARDGPPRGSERGALTGKVQEMPTGWRTSLDITLAGDLPGSPDPRADTWLRRV